MTSVTQQGREVFDESKHPVAIACVRASSKRETTAASDAWRRQAVHVPNGKRCEGGPRVKGCVQYTARPIAVPHREQLGPRKGIQVSDVEVRPHTDIRVFVHGARHHANAMKLGERQSCGVIAERESVFIHGSRLHTIHIQDQAIRAAETKSDSRVTGSPRPSVQEIETAHGRVGDKIISRKHDGRIHGLVACRWNFFWQVDAGCGRVQDIGSEPEKIPAVDERRMSIRGQEFAIVFDGFLPEYGVTRWRSTAQRDHIKIC